MTQITGKRLINMTEGSIARGLILYAIPILLSDFLQQLYSSVDSIIVGNIEGKVALAAVGETFFICNLFLGCFLGVSLGATVCISRSYGAKDMRSVGIAIDTTLKLTLILCAVFTVVGVVLVPTLLDLVGTADDVYADASAYLTVYLGGISSQLIYNMLSGILKAIGDSKRPLYVLAITAVLNVIMDYLMVGPMHMGVAGAAYATVIAQAISCVILWIMICRTPQFEKPILRKCGMDKGVLQNIFKVGLPYSLQRFTVAFSNVIVMSYVNFFGSTVTAGWSIYQKIDQFVISSIISMGSATTTFVSQNVGAKKFERVKKGVNISLLLAFGASILYGIIICVFRRQIGMLFTNDKDVIEFAATIFVRMVPVHIINSFPQIYAGAMRSLDASSISTMIIVGCYVVARQIYLHLRWPYFKNVMIVVAAYHLTWTLCCILCWIFYEWAYRRFVKNTQKTIKQ